MLTDAHCHLHEFSDDEIGKFGDILIAAVSDDVESSRRTMSLAEDNRNVFPFVGIHPWNVQEVDVEGLRKIERMAADAIGLGEIGIDRRYHREAWEKQVAFFEAQLEVAREYGKPVNLHCLDSWRSCLDIVLKYDVPSAVFHWYNGPIELIEEIGSYGYYVSINAAIKIQEKHKEVAKAVRLRRLLLESDGPYDYRGLRLTPKVIPEAMGIVAGIKGIRGQDLEMIVHENFAHAFLSLK